MCCSWLCVLQCVLGAVAAVSPGHCTKAAEKNKSFPPVLGCDLAEMGSLRLAAMASSQREQEQG